MRYQDSCRPRLFAHRGASGRYPENTIEAFAAAADTGIELFELDVHASKDGRIVVFHDDTLQRTTDGSGPVRERRFEELRALDAGYGFKNEQGEIPFRGKGIRIPTLEEVLREFPDTPVNIEIKQLDPPIERAVVEVLDRCDARERVLLAAGDHRILERTRTAAPDVLSGMSAVEVADFLVRSATGALDGYRPCGFALQVPLSHGAVEVVSSSFVEAAHVVGLEVHVWTINETAAVAPLLELGVDGLMSDFPDMLHSSVYSRV